MRVWCLFVVGLNYGFFTQRGNLMRRARLLCGERLFSHTVLRLHRAKKGGAGNYWCSRALALTLSRADFARVVLRSDTEPVIIALRTAIGRH